MKIWAYTHHWCSKRHMHDFMSLHWGQVQWFTFRPFSLFCFCLVFFHLQAAQTTKLSATTHTHNPHTQAHTYEDKWHNPTVVAHICYGMKMKITNNRKVTKKKKKPVRHMWQNESQPWWLLVKHHKSLSNSHASLQTKQQTQEKGQNYGHPLSARWHRGLCLFMWLLCVRQV